ncbi:MAG: multifunctional CCA tRNA nucleotidyl transferase/2'3'-cyclic phosphodiesterase/2'nucleotidase/phosphatase, partial [Burkholderiaceae bacterium]
GYNGFAVHFLPDVTLEEDLARRDLTNNAMAREVLDHHPNDGQDTLGELIDPYNGQHDLRDQILRHVSPAFIEDPVRILRLARFAARWPTFTVAPETMQLMRALVATGET